MQSFSIDTKHGDGGTQRVEALLSLKGMLDGGFYWFDARADEDASLTVGGAVWQVPACDRRTPQPGTMSVAITTFNRPSYCLDQLRAIAGAAELRVRLDTVYCTDRGHRSGMQSGWFRRGRRRSGRSAHVYSSKANLGGSGGFSRGMFETVKAGRSDYTLLLDDDAISEPESILARSTVRGLCGAPRAGGRRHVPYRPQDGAAPCRANDSTHVRCGCTCREARSSTMILLGTVVGQPGPTQREVLHFNGWWFCLIPTETMRAIGLGLPAFIKFDDIEYGVRAKKHGFPTVSLPGVAVWHMGWHDKDPARSWEEYFQVRNRWVCALLHYPNAGKASVFRMLYEEANLGLHVVFGHGVEPDGPRRCSERSGVFRGFAAVEAGRGTQGAFRFRGQYHVFTQPVGFT